MPVTVEARGHATIVTLRWPERRNALGPSQAREVGEAIEMATKTAHSGLVVTGEGAFSAGGDLEQLVQMSESESVDTVRSGIYDNFYSIVRALRDCPVPTCAAVDGPAVGLGFDISVIADICLVGTGGWLQQGWASVGLIHGTGGLGFLGGMSSAAVWKLIAEQRRLDGDMVSSLGLGEGVEGSALEAAVELVERLASLPRHVLGAYVSLQRSVRWPSEEFFESSVDNQARFICSEAFRRQASQILEARRKR